MNKLASLWVGDSFTPLERMCATSFLTQGNPLTVFTYGDVSNVPKGVEIRDANDIVPTSHIVRHSKSGSPSLHSNLFRYALMSKADYVWVDLDLVALRPFDFRNDYIFGWETSEQVGSAVLRLPQTSRTLDDLRKIDAHTRGYPPLIKRSKRIKVALLTLGRGRHISDWPWGSVGPAALTHYLEKYGETIHALPQQTFFHIPWQETRRLLLPNEIMENDLPADCYAVHLWNYHIKKILDEEYNWKIPKSSFIGQMMEKYDIDCELV